MKEDQVAQRSRLARQGRRVIGGWWMCDIAGELSAPSRGEGAQVAKLSDGNQPIFRQQ